MGAGLHYLHHQSSVFGWQSSKPKHDCFSKEASVAVKFMWYPNE